MCYVLAQQLITHTLHGSAGTHIGKFQVPNFQVQVASQNLQVGFQSLYWKVASFVICFSKIPLLLGNPSSAYHWCVSAGTDPCILWLVCHSLLSTIKPMCDVV